MTTPDRSADIRRWPFEVDAVNALHASFAPRVQQLWAAANAAAARPASEPAAGNDKRFASAAWREQPYFAWLKDAYLLYGEYLTTLASLARLPPAEKHRLEFSVRQFVDAMAPTNFPATNPDVLARAIETEGASVIDGLRNFLADVGKGRITMSDESAFEVGRNLAVTPGSVVFRNDADRADPVRRDDAARREAAAPDGAALHQQVLHPRSHARQLVRPPRRRARSHRIHDLVAQHAGRTRQARLGRLPRAGRAGRAHDGESHQPVA